jgi:hypothetical protein
MNKLLLLILSLTVTVMCTEPPRSPVKCEQQIQCLFEASCENFNCATGSTCKVISGTCTTCSSATCEIDPPVSCIDCPQLETHQTCAIENQKCAFGSSCTYTLRTCQTCPQAICLENPPCASCTEDKCSQKGCGTGSTCELTIGDCQTCPVAICVVDNPETDPPTTTTTGGDNATSTSSTSFTSSPTTSDDGTSSAHCENKGVKSLALVIATLAGFAALG